MFAQLTPPSATATAAIVTAAIAATAAIIKKLLPRKESPKPDYISRLEFHQGMDAIRDRLDGHFIGLSEKIENLGTSIHDRLTHLESTIARLDERTQVHAHLPTKN